jgi:hypothetical protein
MTAFHLKCRSASTLGEVTLVQARARMKVLDLTGRSKASETATCTEDEERMSTQNDDSDFMED